MKKGKLGRRTLRYTTIRHKDLHWKDSHRVAVLERSALDFKPLSYSIIIQASHIHQALKQMPSQVRGGVLVTLLST